MPGILSSRIGHLKGSEVVRVEYDPTKTNLRAIVDALKSQSSFYDVVVKDAAEREKAKSVLAQSDIRLEQGEPRFVESKYTLRSQHPDLYYLDLTEQQAIALNTWSYFGGSMPDILTAGQKDLRQKLKAKISHNSFPPMVPARSGKELQLYREKLLKWLND